MKARKMNQLSLKPDADTATALSIDRESSALIDPMMPSYFTQQDLLGDASYGGRASSFLKNNNYTAQQKAPGARSVSKIGASRSGTTLLKDPTSSSRQNLEMYTNVKHEIGGADLFETAAFI